MSEIAATLGLPEEFVEPYGRSVAKVDLAVLTAPGQPTAQRAKYVVVSAVTPTPLGEGKTTTSVGLADGLRHIGVNAAVTLLGEQLDRGAHQRLTRPRRGGSEAGRRGGRRVQPDRADGQTQSAPDR